MIKHLPFISTIALLLFPSIVSAQTYQPSNRTPVADSTLGTQVSGTGNNFNITGGVNKGQTLFHSFTDFSVPTNGAANFLNPANNRDIITRVTGTAFSDINGLLNTNGANFFLINPNGIVFGTNAQLNVGKAFVGSTANSLDLVDGSGRMITFGTNPNGDAPLLSVAPNVLFNVSRLNFTGNTGAINNFGTLQTPNTNQYIGLIGGNVTLDGSSGGGKIVAPGGRVDIGGLSGAGSVSVDNNGLVFSSVGVGRSNVVLTDGAGITVRATGTLDTVNTFFNNAASNGSSLNISANNLALLNAGALSATLPAAIDAGLETNSGVQTKAAGNINIDATSKVNLNNSAIKNTLRSGADGSVGNINIQTGALDVNNNSFISTVTAGKGNAGNVTVTAKDAVSFAGSSVGIFSSVEEGGVGNSGSVNINAGSLSLKDGAVLAASTIGTGNAGNVTVTAKDAVSLSGPTGIFSTVESGGVGKGGIIDINAGSLSLTNGAQLLTTTRGASATQPAGIGDAGNVTIKVSSTVDIGGINGTFRSGIRSTVDTETKGNGGNITIDAGSLSLRDGAELIASTYGTGNAGNVTVTAKDAVSLTNSYILSSVEAGGVGKGGSIAINAGSLSLKDGAQLLTITRGASATQPAGGNAGNVTVKVSGNVDIAGTNGTFRSGVRSDVGTGTKGNGGNITIDAGSVSVRDSAQLVASTSGTGNAGNVTVTAKDAVSLTGNSYILSAVEAGGIGKGGSIDINAGSLSFKDGAQLGTNTSSASATQSAGIGDAGNVTVKVSGAVDISGFGGTFYSGIRSEVETGAKGNGGNISIQAGSLSLREGAEIATSTYGTGNAGNVTVTAKDAVSLAGYSYILSGVKARGVGNGGNVAINAGSVSLQDRAEIQASTSGTGNAGNVTVTAKDAISLTGDSYIRSAVQVGGVGKGGSIDINAGSVFMRDRAVLAVSTYGIGNAGNVTVTAKDAVSLTNSYIFSPVAAGAVGKGGNITIEAGSVSLRDGVLTASTLGQGDTGKITIDVRGKLAVDNSNIFSEIYDTAVGNSNGISITARELELANNSSIATRTAQTAQVDGKGNAGDINIKTTGDILISGSNSLSTNPATVDISSIQSSTYGQGDAGKITIDTQGKLSLINIGLIFSVVGSTAAGNSKGISISAREVELNLAGFIATDTNQITPVNGKGKAGDIELKVNGIISLNNASGISTSSSGIGTAGNVLIAAQQVLFNGGVIFSDADSVSGGNVTLSISDLLLMRNGSSITTSSGGTQKNGNGGNITISSPLIIALPGDNNITANANGGNGGNVNINSQGLFGIQYRSKGQATLSSNDITASSTFGQDGVVNISTPGTDPGRDSTELPNVTTDASNQISQVCSATNRQNKLTVTGRGGIPPNANDPLTSDVVWQDARAASRQPAVSSVTTPVKLAPPAVGWVFDGKGKVTLVAAGTAGQPTGTSVVCPNVVTKERVKGRG